MIKPMEGQPYRWSPGHEPYLVADALMVYHSRQVTAFRQVETGAVFSELSKTGALSSESFIVPHTHSSELGTLLKALMQIGAVEENVGLSTQHESLSSEMARRAAFAEAGMISERLKCVRIKVYGAQELSAAVADAAYDIGLGSSVDIVNERVDEDHWVPLEDEDIVLGVFGNFLDPEAIALNQFLHHNGSCAKALFAGNYDGSRYFIGPWVYPGVTACLECWNIRYRSNLMAIPGELRPREGTYSVGSCTLPPALTRIFSSMVVDTLSERIFLREASGGSRPGGYSVLGVGRNGISLEKYHTTRVPRCKVCSARGGAYPQVWHHD